MDRRYSFQVAWSERDRTYVGTAIAFPMLSHRSDTTEGALAGIQQLVTDHLDGLDTDEETPSGALTEQCPVPCLVCGNPLTSAPGSETDPYDGVTVHIFGNYGSQVFDIHDESTWLQATLCDSCLRSAINAKRVLHAWRSHPPPPPPAYRIAASHDTFGILDNPFLI